MDAMRRLRAELLPILLLVLFAGGIWTFVKLASEVSEGETRRIDTGLLLALREPGDPNDPVGPLWLEEMGRDFTAMGGVGVLTLLTFAVCGFLILDGKRRAAVLVLIAILGALLLSSLLKHGFQRPRPDLVPHDSYVYTSSFPSGHSMMSAATYLTLAALLARVQSQRRLKVFLIGIAVALTLIVGISRVYLGVHWPSDVLAGWTAGGAWASFCSLLASRLQKKGHIETDSQPRN